MKPRQLLVRLFILLLFLFGSSGVLSAKEVLSQETLFSEILGGEAWAPPEDPTIIREKRVHINYNILVSNPQQLPTEVSDAAGSLVLNLFDDVVLTAVLDTLDSTIPEFFSWIGHIEGIKQSNVTLVIGEGMVQGSVTMPDAFYKISHVGNGVHAIYEIDQTAFPKELDPIPVDPPDSAIAFDAISADDGSIIDIIVFYTEAARIAAGGKDDIITKILLAGQSINIGYANSGVIQTINLIDPYAYDPELQYDETNFDWENALIQLRDNREVNELRNHYHADIVVLMVNNRDYCGASFSMSTLSSGFASSAFSLVSLNCSVDNYSLGHELGHVMGSQHDHANAAYAGVYAYSYGYQDPAGAFRTLMAYDCPGGCKRLNYWSNPEIEYNGQPMGIAEDKDLPANNRKSLNNARFTVANFRISTGSLMLTLSPPEAVGAGAQWRVDGGEWRDSGDAETGLSAGSHTVTFSSIDHWDTPASQTVTINSNETTMTIGSYVQQTGALQVTLEPSSARWRVDSGTWRDSGYTQSGLSVGEHTVAFEGVTGWTPPSSQNVTIVNDQTTRETFYYVQQTGALQVTLGPSEAITAGAQWRITGDTTWWNSGDTQSGIAVGGCIVEFKAVSGWTAPGDKTVQITNGGTTTETGTYILIPVNTPTGSLTVTLSPPEAVYVGARWRVDGGDWFNSDYTQPGLTTGSHTVEFSEVDGYTPPGSQSVTIADGQTTTASGRYAQQTGSLTVTLGPAEAITTGAQWRVDDGEWRDSGFAETGLAVGSHTVEFSTVPGWTEPDNQSVAISNGETVSANGNYIQVATFIDSDQDGVSDDEEAMGPNGGDGNNDGIPDSQQANVATLQTTDAEMITLETASNVSIRNCRAVDTSSSGSVPTAVEFFHGLFEFSLVGVDPGGMVSVTVYLPDGETADVYYKFGPTADDGSDYWYDFTHDGQTGAEIDGNRITLHFIDGQRGDDDLVANGTIADIGGPGISTVTTGGGSSSTQNDSDSGGGGGGGCFIGTIRR